uniref:Uncharacterized protein n=1 Tax=Arundo donax TaxID=35708 RepID=A0A0A9GWV8_ARUDO
MTGELTRGSFFLPPPPPLAFTLPFLDSMWTEISLYVIVLAIHVFRFAHLTILI